MSACIGCGEREAIEPSAICAECHADFQAETKAPKSQQPDCGRTHPWPVCRCLACATALDAVFTKAAKDHARLREHGKSLVTFEPTPPRRVGANGKTHVALELEVEDVALLERASMLAGLRRGPWIKLAIRRQGWLEVQGQGDLVKRVEELTNVVAVLLRKVESLSAQQPRARRPRRE